MPVRPMTDAEAERIFGGGLVLFGQKRPQPSNENKQASPSEAPTVPTDLQNLPMDPASAVRAQLDQEFSQPTTTEKPPASRY